MEPVLQQFLVQMQELAPETLELLIILQRTKFVIFGHWWWILGLIAIALGVFAYIGGQQTDDSWDFITIGCILIGLLCLIVCFVMVFNLLVLKPIFEASPAVYVLRDLFN